MRPALALAVAAGVTLAACAPAAKPCPAAPPCPTAECAPCPPPADLLAVEAAVVTRHLCRDAFVHLAAFDAVALRERLADARQDSPRLAAAAVVDTRGGLDAARPLVDDASLTPAALPPEWPRAAAAWRALAAAEQPRRELRLPGEPMTFLCPVYLADTTYALVLTTWR